MERKIDLLKAIRTFLVVCDEMSFSKAAIRLQRVTSAVSRQVSDLESYYDCQMLYRTTRHMHLTAEGEMYRAQFESITQQLDQLEQSALERREKISGHLKVTAPMNISRLGVQSVISDYLKQYPDVRLSWLLVNRYVNLTEEGVDLAIRVGQLEDSGLIARPLTRIQVLFVASPEYLEQRGCPEHPKDLLQHQCIIDSSNRQPGRWRYQDRVSGKTDVRTLSISSSLDVNQGHLVAEFAARGQGIAQLPEFLLTPYLETGELIPILESYNIPDLPVSLVYPADRIRNPALTRLTEQLIQAFSALGR